MRAKLKAEEIVEQFYAITGNKIKAVNCALILVREILEIDRIKYDINISGRDAGDYWARN